MDFQPQDVLIFFAVLAAIIFLVGVVYTMTQFRRMDERPHEFEGSDPETHYRR